MRFVFFFHQSIPNPNSNCAFSSSHVVVVVFISIYSFYVVFSALPSALLARRVVDCVSPVVLSGLARGGALRVRLARSTSRGGA